ncbi:MAG: DsrH/TusB family sulfur metabolism protein [Pseudomonadota bacterium]
MSTLHVLYPAEWPMALERLWSAGDTLLLAGASVSLALSPNGPLQHFMQRRGSGARVVALEDAVHCRGLPPHWPKHITLINADAWVELVTRHPKSLSWA